MLSRQDDNRSPEWAATGYAITNRLTRDGPVAIVSDVYRGLLQAADDLRTVLAVEEAYELLIRNYVSLEKATTASLIDFMVDNASSRVFYERHRREADRQIVNLLASGEMYADHIARSVRRLERSHKQVGSQAGLELVSRVRGSIEAQRMKLLGFRSLEKLRNHVLHLSLPVEGWHQGNAWVEHNGVRVMRVTYDVALNPMSLGKTREVPQALIAELMMRSDKDGRVPWHPLVREYVEGLSHVHKTTRDVLEPIAASARDVIQVQKSHYMKARGLMEDDPHGTLSVAKVDQNNQLIELRALEFDFDQIVADLREQNGAPLVNLHKRQVMR